MKIEKVNENQIRCTLTREDLADRQIRVSELAYGSEKARSLFRDMIQQANYEFGFEVNDIPLMVEAIPSGADTIILVITKVEYPEELDTRFSKFSEPDADLLDAEDIENEAPAMPSQGADDILDLFRKMEDAPAAKEDPGAVQKKEDVPEPKAAVRTETDLTKMFEFRTLDQVDALAHVLNGYYNGENDLYHNVARSRYVLFVRKSHHTPEEFNKVCNIASEYAMQTTYTKAIGSFYREHGKRILQGRALQTLAQI